MKTKITALALMLAMMIPGAQAIAAGTDTVLTATEAPYEMTAAGEAPADTMQYMALDEFVIALGMEPPLGETESLATGRLHEFYLSVSGLLDRLRAALPAEGLPESMTLVELEWAADALDNDMDAFEDTLQSTYRDGGLTRAQYRFFSTELEYMEDMLDGVEEVCDVLLDDDYRYLPEGQTRGQLMRAMADALRLEYPRQDPTAPARSADSRVRYDDRDDRYDDDD